jgi:cysteinyl-tRNA synthetase
MKLVFYFINYKIIMLRIYDTLSKELKEFHPINKDKVTFYHCGPTVYWVQHIGNLRGMTMADLIRRSMEYLGHNVVFARNYTDVGHLTGDNIGDADTGEDRMEKAARKEGITPDEIANKYIEIFNRDLELLNNIVPSHRPRATEYINQMIELVQTLLEKDFAYTTSKAVYFDVTKKDDYTKLSGQKLEQNKQGAGSGDVTDPDKKNPQDFALWFFKTGVHSNALQTWESAFESPEVLNGEGFPGWHIECSAMSMELLGETIDLHMGGIEHIPIHHTNEIAQTESATGKEFVNYWLHNEHLTVDGGKMSKSLGNVYSLDEIIKKGYDPLVLRYFFLQSHYRSKQNFTWEAMDGANSAYQKLKNKIQELQKDSENELVEIDARFKENFANALENDFNIPQALSIVWDIIKSDLSNEKKYATIIDFDRVLGLNLDKKNVVEVSDEVQELLDERLRARENNDWAESDRIRDLIKSKFNLEVKDTTTGQILN